MDNWYIIYNGAQAGPMNKSQLTRYGLNPASIVWHPGMPDWLPAAQVAELADLLSPAVDVEVEEVNGPSQQEHYNSGYSNSGNYSGPHANPQDEVFRRAYNQGFYDGSHNPNGYVDTNGKSKVAAGILAILLGGLGIQYFYLGKIGGGFITILLTIVTCGLWEVITFVQGIMMLCMSDEEFARKYVFSDKTFPLF